MTVVDQSMDGLNETEWAKQIQESEVSKEKDWQNKIEKFEIHEGNMVVPILTLKQKSLLIYQAEKHGMEQNEKRTIVVNSG